MFAANDHPRGADGKFLNTGGRVVVAGQNGQPDTEGTVTETYQDQQGNDQAVVKADDGTEKTVPVAQVTQAPTVRASLSSAGSVPPSPGSARAAARADAKAGLPPRGTRDAYGNVTPADAIAAYNQAYAQEQALVAKQNASKAATLAKKKLAAQKKAAAAARASAKASASAASKAKKAGAYKQIRSQQTNELKLDKFTKKK